MAINQVIIRIRRGLKDELQIDKLLPGELAMATDAPCMWFCWSPGEVEQVPTTGNVIEHISQIVTEYIANNDISVIGKVFMRIYNGWIQYSPDEKTWKNVISLADIRGDEGGYYIPVINNNGIISWKPSQEGMEELQDSLILSKDIIEAVLGYVPLKNKDVVDNLVSTATDLPLSAKQGNVLDGKISTLNTNCAKKSTANDFSNRQKISYNADIDSGLYNDAPLIIEADTSGTGALAAIGFHNAGATGLGLYLSGTRLKTITNSGVENQLAHSSEVSALQSKNALSVSWNSAGVSSGWAYGYYFPNLGFGILQGGFIPITTGPNLTLGTITGTCTVSQDMVFVSSTADGDGLGASGTVKTNKTLVFKIPSSGKSLTFNFCCFLF